MPAILAKKLGMTQVFQEDGSVARVTVLEAGPCPVTAIRTVERDGYEAVQLAFGASKEKHLSKAELGHLTKADAPPMRTLVEFRGEVGELTLGESVTVEAFEVGSRVKIAGISKGKGFQGTIKRHNFSRGPSSHGSHNVRAPGLDRRLGDALARLQRASAAPARWATSAPRRRASRSIRIDAEREPAARPRLGSRPARRDRGGAQRWLRHRS